MVDLSALGTHAWAIVLFSLVITALIFPLVFIMVFVYEWLERKHPKAPKVLLMIIVTFLGVLLATAAIEAYLQYTLPQVISAAFR